MMAIQKASDVKNKKNIRIKKKKVKWPFDTQQTYIDKRECSYFGKGRWDLRIKT